MKQSSYKIFTVLITTTLRSKAVGWKVDSDHVKVEDAAQKYLKLLLLYNTLKTNSGFYYIIKMRMQDDEGCRKFKTGYWITFHMNDKVWFSVAPFLQFYISKRDLLYVVFLKEVLFSLIQEKKCLAAFCKTIKFDSRTECKFL